MSLRHKIAFILLSVITGYVLTDYAIQRYVIFPRFEELERIEAQRNMDRFIEALGGEIQHLSLATHDWAAWDDTYQFVDDFNDDYRVSNLMPQTFIDLDINLLHIYDATGGLVWGEVRDPATNALLDFDSVAFHALVSDNSPPAPQEDLDGAKGVVLTERGPLLVASKPISTSDHTGPIRGDLVMGRLLGQDRIDRLARQTRVNVQLRPLGGDALLSASEARHLGVLKGHKTSMEVIKDKGLIYVYAAVPDLDGKEALLVRADVPRNITLKGRETLGYAILSTLAVGLVVLVTLLVLLRRIVLAPLLELTGHAARIGRRDDLQTRLDWKRGDEIGTLAGSLDRMVEEINQARQRQVDQSYHSGMAEMAGGLLHNVRNAMNPITLNTERLLHRLSPEQLILLDRFSRELVEGDPSPERRDDLVRYIGLSSRGLCGIMQDTRDGLADVLGIVGRIDRMLDNHYQLVRAERLAVDVRLDEALSDSLSLVAERLRNLITVEADPSLKETGPVKTQKAPLLVILSSLITNAAESVERMGGERRPVVVSAGFDNSVGDRMVHLRVTDNGSGIEPENLQRIFELGYSTKTDKASGMGLSWSAGVAAALGGRLYAESGGPGEGAEMHLLIPHLP